MQSGTFWKLWAWFEKNKRQVTWGAAALVAVGLGVWLFVWQQNEKEVSASEALSAAAMPQLMMPGAGPATADGLLKIAASYPKSSAAARAVLMAGASLFVEGKYTEAQGLFERFTREYRDSPFMGQALLGIAACQDAMGKTNDAITAYKDIVDRHPGETVVPQAKFALARLYELQNKPEQARILFEDVARNDPAGSLGSEAGMRLEELLARHPELAPKPATPTNALPLRLEKK